MLTPAGMDVDRVRGRQHRVEPGRIDVGADATGTLSASQQGRHRPPKVGDGT